MLRINLVEELFKTGALDFIDPTVRLSEQLSQREKNILNGCLEVINQRDDPLNEEFKLKPQIERFREAVDQFNALQKVADNDKQEIESFHIIECLKTAAGVKGEFIPIEKR